jgi:DNA-binding NarL/FixJ family response regulator
MARTGAGAYSQDMVATPNYEPLEILLVEDNQTFATAVKDFLTLVNGVKLVGHATNGPQAITQTLRLHPNLILMDIGLQGMNGFEIASLVLDLEHPPTVIFLSMHDGEAYRAKAKKMGADGFVSKNNFATDLFPLIDKLIEKRLMH